MSVSVSDSYHGSGWVLAAIANSTMIAVRYIEDIAPLSADHLDGDRVHGRRSSSARAENRPASSFVAS